MNFSVYKINKISQFIDLLNFIYAKKNMRKKHENIHENEKLRVEKI